MSGASRSGNVVVKGLIKPIFEGFQSHKVVEKNSEIKSSVSKVLGRLRWYLWMRG